MGCPFRSALSAEIRFFNALIWSGEKETGDWGEEGMDWWAGREPADSGWGLAIRFD